MTTDLPDPHACPHCGSPRFDSYDGVVQCASCNAPRATATPGCPVRNAMLSRATDETFEQSAEAVAKEHSEALRMLAESERKARDDVFRQFYVGKFVHAESVADETARERKVHGGGPRVVG